MLRSLSRALFVTALVAAPAGAQFSGSVPGTPFDGQFQYSSGTAASNGLTRIENPVAPDVVVASPEPAGVALVATGLIGVFGIARRKRN